MGQYGARITGFTLIRENTLILSKTTRRRRWKSDVFSDDFSEKRIRKVRIPSKCVSRYTAIACWCLPALIGFGDEPSVDYYHPNNILKFAAALYREGDYLRATGECHRYLFYNPQNANQILYQIAVSYRLGGQANRALEFLKPSWNHTFRATLPGLSAS